MESPAAEIWAGTGNGKGRILLSTHLLANGILICISSDQGPHSARNQSIQCPSVYICRQEMPRVIFMINLFRINYLHLIRNILLSRIVGAHTSQYDPLSALVFECGAS